MSDPRKQGKTNFYAFETPEELEAAFKSGQFDPRELDKDGSTWMHHAEQPWQVEALWKAGVPLNARDKRGKTPLDVVMQKFGDSSDQALGLHFEMQMKGGRTGVELDKEIDSMGKFRVHPSTAPWPVFENAEAVMDYYTGKDGHSPDERDANDNTKMHYARELWEIRALTGVGVPLNAVNKQGKTALDVALASEGLGEQGERAKALRQMGAHTGTEMQHLAAEKKKRDRELEAYANSIRDGVPGGRERYTGVLEFEVLRYVMKDLYGQPQKKQRSLNWDFKQDQEYGNSDLHKLALFDTKSALDMIRQARIRGVSLDQKNHEGLTPLAALISAPSGRENKLEIAAMLLENGAAVNVRDYKGFAPIHRAAAASPDILRLLVSKDPRQLEYKSADGYTPLHLARSASAVHAILENGNPELLLTAPDRKGQQPIHLARSAAVVEALLEHGDDPSRRAVDAAGVGRTPIMSMVSRKDNLDGAALEALIKGGADIRATDNTYEENALAYCKTAYAADFVLRRAPDLASRQNINGENALYRVSEAEVARLICQELVEHDPEYFRNNNPALALAANNAIDEEVYHTLAENGVKLTGQIGATGETLLHEAKDPKMLEFFAKNDPGSINAQDSMGMTALGNARTQAMVDACLKLGADARIKDAAGRSMGDHVLSRAGLILDESLMNREGVKFNDEHDRAMGASTRGAEVKRENTNLGSSQDWGGY